MSRGKQATHRAKIAWAIVLVMGCTLIASPAQAIDWSWFRSFFPRSSGWGPPSGNSSSAAHRGGACATAISDRPLTALAPTSVQAGDELALGATASASPTLWFYSPYDLSAPPPSTPYATGLTNATAKPFAELRLEEQDADGRYYPQSTLMTLPETKAGIMGIRLTEVPLQPPLEVGKLYHWLLVVHCLPGDASANKFTRLSLFRVPSDSLAQQREPTIPAQQRDFYIKYGLWEDVRNGVWNDFITTFAKRRCRSPKDAILSTRWSQSLEDVGLKSIATQRLICPISSQ